MGFKRIFIKLFSGLFFVVTLFSLIATKGVTINVLIVVLVLILFLRTCVWKKWNYSRLWKDLFSDRVELLMTLVPLGIFFTWRYYTLYSTTTDIPVVINMDSLKHVIRAGFLVSTGIESVNINYINLPEGVDPYHYFEAWSIGLFGSLFKNNFWITEQVIVYPLYSTFIVVGFWGIIEKWQPKWYIYTLGLGVVCNTGLYFEEVETLKFFKYTGGFAINAFDEWKGFTVSVAYLVVMLFLNLLFSRVSLTTAIITLLILPIISITLAPGILTIVTLLMFILFLFKDKLEIDMKRGDILVPILMAVLIYLFYKYFEATQVYIDKPNLVSALQKLMSLGELKTRAIIIFEKIIQSIVFFSPFIAVSMYFFIKNKMRFRDIFMSRGVAVLFYIIIIGSCISMSFWMLFYYSFGSGQFLFYTMAPFVNISSLLFFVVAIIHEQRWVLKLGLTIILIVINVLFFSRSNDIYVKGRSGYFDKYSVEYVNEVVTVIGEMKEKKGFKIEDPNEITKYNDTHHSVGNFLPGVYNEFDMISITKGVMYVEQNYPVKEAKMLLPKAPMAEYFQGLMNNNNFIGTEEAVLQLIQHENYNFVFVPSKLKLPNYLNSLVKQVIIDDKTGEQLFLFGQL